MVEKWLLQVEDVMISSLRKVIIDSHAAYVPTPRNRWVLEWSGQVVICTSSIYWTVEVEESMKVKDGMKVRRGRVDYQCQIIIFGTLFCNQQQTKSLPHCVVPDSSLTSYLFHT